MRMAEIANGEIVNVAIFEDGTRDFGPWKAVTGGEGIGWTDAGGGTFEPPVVVVPKERKPTAREAREKSLDGITHDFGDGRVVFVGPQTTPRFRDAIDALTADDTRSDLLWTAIDGSRVTLTLQDLKDALAAGVASSLTVWDTYDRAL